jgi:hypothetical protein
VQTSLPRLSDRSLPLRELERGRNRPEANEDHFAATTVGSRPVRYFPPLWYSEVLRVFERGELESPIRRSEKSSKKVDEVVRKPTSVSSPRVQLGRVPFDQREMRWRSTMPSTGPHQPGGAR